MVRRTKGGTNIIPVCVGGYDFSYYTCTRYDVPCTMYYDVHPCHSMVHRTSTILYIYLYVCVYKRYILYIEEISHHGPANRRLLEWEGPHPLYHFDPGNREISPSTPKTKISSPQKKIFFEIRARPARSGPGGASGPVPN